MCRCRPSAPFPVLVGLSAGPATGCVSSPRNSARPGSSRARAGRFRQSVPFVELAKRPDAALRISGAGGETLLEYADDAVYWTKRVGDQSRAGGAASQ